MTTASIGIVGGDYEHTLGLAGSYGGLELRYETMRVQDIFAGMLEERRFEVCEFSLANYLVLRATGQHWLTALPVFPSRAFRHSLAVTRRDSPLTHLDALAGKRIGVEDYSMTAAVWFRGLLRDEHGIEAESITWVTHAKQRLPFPPNANVETTHDDLEALLVAGKIDSMLGFTLKDSQRPAGERRLRPLLADSRREERAYFERTGIYPISHCVVVRNDVLDKHPHVVRAVVEAYTAGKARAYARQLGTTLVPWGKGHWSESFALFGGDPLPYGLTPENRKVIERLGSYLRQQGFIRELPEIGSLFATPL